MLIVLINSCIAKLFIYLFLFVSQGTQTCAAKHNIRPVDQHTGMSNELFNYVIVCCFFFLCSQITEGNVLYFNMRRFEL